MAGNNIPQASGGNSAGMSCDFIFRGSLMSESFLDFARHRAARLDLTLTVGICDTQACMLTVRGPDALIDAFEMAVSLGPYDCIIIDIERSDHPHG
ncbi:hypothetical protein [Rhizobium sp. CECT 9324]|uniref:hypothetical protein n=1 Tax=Rhizobium sp. CECT 9324 TaxID=2845820 RepID=UPI001E385573|nr:hypothetical protein [Rhizobium sp. CECT 9324]CAH0341946.1 hypothetical protein RHI9324_03654 [Rhizobium sp. CECT 9324]